MPLHVLTRTGRSSSTRRKRGSLRRRRTPLRYWACLFLLIIRPPAHASSPTASRVEGGKKERWLEQKAKRATVERSRTAAPAAEVALAPIWAFSFHQRELLVLDPRHPPTKDQIDAFLRCRFSTQEADMPAALIARILEAAQHFDVSRVFIVSGYRSPKLNLALRKKGRQVAATSQHTRGQAIDFQLPGVPVKTLYRWLLKHHDGGVGFYATSEFVHIDTGRKRTWRGT